MAKPKNKLEELRRINFLSQREVAEKLGVTQNSYSLVERGERGLTLEKAMKLKEIFQVQYIDDLFDKECAVV